MADTNLPGTINMPGADTLSIPSTTNSPATMPQTNVNTVSSTVPVQPQSPQDQKLAGLGLNADQIRQLNTPGGMNAGSFTGLMDSINTRLKVNNDLVTQRSYLTSHLYDAPLSPEALAKLPPDMQTIVKSGDKNLIELQMRVLNDQISGRAGTLNESIKNLTSGYETAQTNVKNAMTQILAYAQSTGKPIGEVAKALAPIYGVSVTDQMMKNIEQLGGTLQRTNQMSPTGAYSVSIPAGTIASQTNNPLNIKFSDTVVGFGGSNSGIAGQDGGSFASFNSPVDGIQAGIKLLKSDVYAGLTVDEAMKKWSNNGYGAEVSPSLNAGQMVSSLSDTQLQQLTSDMATRESGASFSAATSDSVQGMLDIYKTTGAIPPLGKATMQERNQFYTAIHAGGTGLVAGASSNKAAIAGATTALRTQTNQYAANQTSIGTLDKQLSLVQSFSDKVDRSGSPLFNKYLLYVKGQVAGDADTSAFQNIVNTASAEFAKILSGSSASIAGATVSSQEDAKNLLNGSMNAGQLKTVIGLMKAESEYRLQSQKDTIDTLQGDIKQIGSGSSSGDARSKVMAAGFDYDSIKKDNPQMSDDEILKAAGL